MMFVNRSGRLRKPTIQRSPVRNPNIRISVVDAAFQRSGSLTGMTNLISRVHESWTVHLVKSEYQQHKHG